MSAACSLPSEINSAERAAYDALRAQFDSILTREPSSADALSAWTARCSALCPRVTVEPDDVICSPGPLPPSEWVYFATPQSLESDWHRFDGAEGLEDAVRRATVDLAGKAARRGFNVVFDPSPEIDLAGRVRLCSSAVYAVQARKVAQ